MFSAQLGSRISWQPLFLVALVLAAAYGHLEVFGMT